MADNMDLEAGGVKYDTEKIRMDLNPQDALMATAAVFSYGAKKYDEWNWAKGMRAGRLTAAMQRHLAAFSLGEDVDEESNLPHLWHLGCCALMLIGCDLRGALIDDRADDLSVDALDIVRETFKEMHEPVVVKDELG